jgi:hypothetical protein
VTIIVDAIESVFWSWFRTHILTPTLEPGFPVLSEAPAVTDGDAALAVKAIILVVGAIAAQFH